MKPRASRVPQLWQPGANPRRAGACCIEVHEVQVRNRDAIFLGFRVRGGHPDPHAAAQASGEWGVACSQPSSAARSVGEASMSHVMVGS